LTILIVFVKEGVRTFKGASMFSNLMQWEKYSKIGGDKEKMMRYAGRFGYLLNAFTGEHVGEPGLLICLYDEALLHLDIKFVMVEEFGVRVEDPALLLDKGGVLKGGLREALRIFRGWIISGGFGYGYIIHC